MTRRRGARKRTAAPWILLYGIVPLLLSGFSLAEWHRNRHVLVRGTPAQAVVTRTSETFHRRFCAIEYRFVTRAGIFTGDAAGCARIRMHPPGRPIAIRYQPGNPARSLPMDASPWPGIGWPALVLALAAVLTPAWLLSAILLAIERTRRRRRIAKLRQG